MTSKYFVEEEFTCKCGCGVALMDPDLLDLLERTRASLNKPMRLTSAFRCSEHNAAVGGVTNSAHTRGYAVDIACPDSQFRYYLLKEAIKKFPRIGIAKSFIHVDCDPALPDEVVWLY